MRNVRWTTDAVHAEARRIAEALGHFPSASELRAINRGDLTNQIRRKGGGFVATAATIGAIRRESCSDKGWRGEELFCSLCDQEGLAAVRTKGVKFPYDVLVSECVRVDVKAANYIEYAAA